MVQRLGLLRNVLVERTLQRFRVHHPDPLPGDHDLSRPPAGMGDLSFNRSFEHRKLILGATVLNFLIVLIGFFVQPSFAGISVPNVGWAYGSFIGLIAAVIAAAPSVMPIIQAQRLK